MQQPDCYNRILSHAKMRKLHLHPWWLCWK